MPWGSATSGGGSARLHLNRRVSHNVVTMETGAIGWPP